MTAVRKWWCALAVFMVLACAPAAQAEPFTFTLLPGGDISGEAGSTIGWEYSLTNLSTDEWLVLWGFNSDPFVGATPDASLFDFPILAPGATILGGLFQITWDALAPIGLVNSGFFVLSADWYDGDPFDTGNAIGTTQFSAAYSATVTGAAPVPEPGTLWLMASGAALLYRQRRTRVRPV